MVVVSSTGHGADTLIAGQSHNHIRVIHDAERVWHQFVEASHKLVVAYFRRAKIVEHAACVGEAHLSSWLPYECVVFHL